MQSPKSTPPRWFAVMTRPGGERFADTRLRSLGFWTFYPFHRIRRRRRIPGSTQFRIEWIERPYFTGYLFVGLRENEDLGRVVTAPGVMALVQHGEEPLELPAPVMDELMERADGGGMIGEYDLSCAAARKLFERGEVVHFAENSPLAGLIAQIELDAGKEISVWVQMFGSRRKVSVAPDAIASAI